VHEVDQLGLFTAENAENAERKTESHVVFGTVSFARGFAPAKLLSPSLSALFAFSAVNNLG